MSAGQSFEKMRTIRGWLLARSESRAVVALMAGDRPVYRVPSETRAGIGYDIFVDEDGVFVCTCADFAARHKACKHLVEILYRFHPDIAPPVPAAAELAELGRPEMYSGARRFARKAFVYMDGPSESTRRDRALSVESERLEWLLLDLAGILNERYPQNGAHRHALPPGDRVVSLVLRDYHRKSYRATPALLRPLALDGKIAFAPCKNTLITYLQDRAMLRYLQEAFMLTISPFQMMEQDVLVDASGISPFYFESYRAITYGNHKSPQAKWFRIHVAVGRLSHAVLGFALTPSGGPGTGDINHLVPLLDGIQGAGFALRFVIADNAYLHQGRIVDVQSRGAVLITPIKVRNRDRDGRVKVAYDAVEIFANRYPELYDELLRARQAVEGFFSLEKRRSNRLASIGTREERAKLASGEHSGLFLARINEFYIRMIRYNLTRINIEEHLRDRHVRFSKGSLFSHVRETIGDDDVA